MRSYSAQELFDLVFPEWHVFHVIVKQGSHASRAFDAVLQSWQDVIGSQRVVPLDDHTKIGEVIVSTMEVTAGKSYDDIVKSWDGSTSIIVGAALKDVMQGSVTKSIDSYL